MATSPAGPRFARFGDAPQEKAPRRAIRKIVAKITSLLGAVGLWASAVACGPSVVDLGARGGVAGSTADASAPASGSGGASGGGAAGSQAGAGEAGSGGAVSGGAGSEPVPMNDAGVVPPPDAGVIGPGAEPSTGCGMQPPTSDTSITTVRGSTAGYIVDLPTGYDPSKPYPLVLSFRGAMVSVEAFRRTLDLPAVVGADGIVVNVDCANGANMWDLLVDPPVFEELLAKLEDSYCIDRRRVFVVGHQTGAIFANVLACRYAGVLRGLGSISGVAPMEMCTGDLAVWISQGSADPTFRMLGRDTRDFWIQQNQCDATMSAPVEPSSCIEFMGCEMGSPVRYCEYPGNQAVPSFAAAAVWDFLKGL